MANLSGPREDIPRDLGWATVPVRRLCSMEEPPSLEDVGLGDPQAVALDPMGQGHRLAAPAAGVDLDEAEGLVALVADHPFPFVPEAPVLLGAGVAGVEGDLDRALPVAADEEPHLL